MTDSSIRAAPVTPVSSTTGPRLLVENLRITTVRGIELVDEIGFQVAAGEVLGLVGESGSGKTSVALAILGYARRGLRIDAGRILLDGTDVTRLSSSKLRAVRGSKVSYVPQDPTSALNPALRVGAQLSGVLRSHPEVTRDIEERVKAVLDEVRLPPTEALRRCYPHQLSGGQKQRVALAMAFACRPSLIVLDEPTTGLDVSTQRHVLETVRALCSGYGVAAVYVSHDLAVVEGLASTIAVMYAGRVVEMGPTEQVFGRPVHPYTRALLAAIPLADRSQQLRGIAGQPPRPGNRPPGCHFAPRCPLRLDACSKPPPEVDAGGRRVRCWRATEVALAASERGDAIRARPVSGSPILMVSDLSASYASTEVLHRVTVDVPAHSCTAIVGESGSGKTTLARCIVGLHRDCVGTMSFAGEPLRHDRRERPKRVLQRMQYIFQDPYSSLNPRKTIGQLVAQPLEHFFSLNRQERGEKVRAALADVLLSADYVERYPDQLSGGERQRVALARALVLEPELLVCDEITSALDVSVQAMIIELLRRMQDGRRLTMIFITHNLALVRSIAQSIVVISDGTVVESGLAEDVLTTPRHPYTIGLMQDVPQLSARSGAAEIPGSGVPTRAERNTT